MPLGLVQRVFKFDLIGNSPTPSQVWMWIQTSRDVLRPVVEVEPIFVTDPSVVESVVMSNPVEHPHNT